MNIGRADQDILPAAIVTASGCHRDPLVSREDLPSFQGFKDPWSRWQERGGTSSVNHRTAYSCPGVCGGRGQASTAPPVPSTCDKAKHRVGSSSLPFLLLPRLWAEAVWAAHYALPPLVLRCEPSAFKCIVALSLGCQNFWFKVCRGSKYHAKEFCCWSDCFRHLWFGHFHPYYITLKVPAISLFSWLFYITSKL